MHAVHTLMNGCEGSEAIREEMESLENVASSASFDCAQISLPIDQISVVYLGKAGLNFPEPSIVVRLRLICRTDSLF